MLVAPHEALAQRLAGELRGCLTAALERRGRAAIALSGGSVSERLLPSLAQLALPWGAVDIFWCDERSVPGHDPRSNAGVAAGIVAGTPLGAARWHPMPVAAARPAAAADRYAAEIRNALGPSLRFDAVLLGVGEDGHVASLFPGLPALDEAHRLVVPVTGAPKPPPDRMTLTLPLLAGAGLVVVAAFGAAKSPAVAHALESGARSPLGRVLAAASDVLLLLDPPAASRLHLGDRTPR